MRNLSTILALLLCACSHNQPKQETLQVAGAASMTDAVGAIFLQYRNEKGGEISTNFGASSTVARQIADGAPADVYVSANLKWVDYLAGKGLVEGRPRVIAHNRLVCVVQKESTYSFDSLDSMTTQVQEIAVADEGVPAGEYARQALGKASILDKLKLVGQKDVRAVAFAVGMGSIGAGFVYASDAKQLSDMLRVAFVVDPKLHDPIIYYAALLKHAQHPQAGRDFFNFLQSGKAKQQLAKLGFSSD